MKEIFNHTSIIPLQNTIRENRSILVEKLWDSPKALITSIAAQQRAVLLITASYKEENQIFHDIKTFSDKKVFDFPAWETMPNEKIAPSPDIVGERYELLKELFQTKDHCIILTSLQACLQKLIPKENFCDLSIKLKTKEEMLFDLLIEQFANMGYERKNLVSDKGEFATRGDIIDIFPVSSPDPFRIEFWTDEIENIRSFDPIGQKSIAQINEIEILPAKEMEMLQTQKKLSSLLDYLPKETIIIFDDLLAIEDKYASIKSQMTTKHPFFTPFEDFLKKAKSFQKIFFSKEEIEKLSDIQVLENKSSNFYSSKNNFCEISFSIFNSDFTANRWISPFQSITSLVPPDHRENIQGEDLLQEIPQNKKVIFLTSSTAEEKNLKNIFKSDSTLYKGYLSSGFVIEDQVIFPFTEISKKHKIRRQKLRNTYHSAPSEVFELKPGDLVVHLNNGIGKFIETSKKKDHNGIEREFFVVEYADEAKLYTPLTQAHLLSKYIGAGAKTPKIHTLGSSRWQKIKESTEKAINVYAKDLLELYAKREYAARIAYPADGEEMQLFEEEFPFIETNDQEIAITNIKQDMQNKKPMDHLICGDVGYGKTEVAMRAAFKAVVDGNKQVAMLVPTTVLAMQHYETFIDRMKSFPVKIGLLSRFNKTKQTREMLEGAATGSIDIIVGTHRMLSKDVSFKNLGLIIIDEEQRFGVKSKEHLRKMKNNADCLTLSATPIPRTLYMSLMGARDMSVINTPPQDRVPIKTIISEHDNETIKNALLRELARDGQAFFIHNRVETIYEVASDIRKLLPQARILVAHGQMPSQDINATFHAFKEGRADILVATTIVENGLDIPNANTIFISNATHFGLADLYQLRGRVGRWNRRAYAYLLLPKGRFTPQFAIERLSILATTSGYGGGMKIAMRDLELRGAGNILGTEQSGHITAIGFHLYCKLLKKTINQLTRISHKISQNLDSTVHQSLSSKSQSLISNNVSGICENKSRQTLHQPFVKFCEKSGLKKSDKPQLFCETKMEFPQQAAIPPKYIDDTSLRMEMYHRIGEVTSNEDLEEIMDEMKDRFGKFPHQLVWLYHLTRIKIFASQNSFSSLKLKDNILLATQTHGKQNIEKTIKITTSKKPKQLEKEVINQLTQNFPLYKN